MTPKEKEGYEFVRGGITIICEACIWLLFILGCWMVIANNFNIGVDDTDKNGWERSGLKVHYDAKTGVEYLSDQNGGLIKREPSRKE